MDSRQYENGQNDCRNSEEGPYKIITQKEYDQLKIIKDSVIWLHSQKADDMCWMDIEKIYKAAGLPPKDRGVGDKFAMLKNCIRFIDRNCEEGGWPTYVDLEEKIKKLEEQITWLESQK